MKDIVKHFFDKVDVMQFLASVTILIVFIMVVNALIYRIIPPENKEILINVLGVIEGSVMTIVTFYYGSSKGSAKKDDALKAKDEMLMAAKDKPGVTITPEPGTTTTTEVKTEG